MNRSRPSLQGVFTVILAVLILAGLYASSLYSYLFFHSIAEIFSVVVAFSIFVLAWNSRRFLQNHYLLFIGIASLFVSFLNLAHVLAYKGMGVFQGYDANLATQLWIAFRYLFSLSLLAAPLFIRRPVQYPAVFSVYTAVTVLALVSIFGGIFPDCYVEGSGLTQFKIVSEYVISAVFAASGLFLWLLREHFDREVLRYLLTSILASVGSELAFTQYVSVYGLANLAGHYLEIISFYFLYRAIIVTGLVQPYDLVFRDLAQGEEALRRAKADLEARVEERTSELKELASKLGAELLEREHAEAMLLESEHRYRSLIEEASDIICTLSTGGAITSLNPAFERVTGWPRSEWLGRPFSLLLHPDDANASAKMLERYASGEMPLPCEFRARCQDGRYLHLEFKATPLSRDGQVTAVFGIGRDITERKRTEEEVLSSREELRNLSTYLVSVREEERTHIAREIHDELGQVLTALKMDISWIGIKWRDIEPLYDKTRSMLVLVDSTIHTVKRIATELRPRALDDLGLAAAIEWQAGEFQKRTGMACEVQFSPEEINLDLDRSTTIFRIFQEALTNIARHAGATCVTVSLEERAGEVVLTVTDNGKGITDGQASDPQSYGLIGIRERTLFWGGNVTIGSAPGRGTKLIASIPTGRT